MSILDVSVRVFVAMRRLSCAGDDKGMVPMSFDQMPLGGDADIFMRNPEPRCPVVLLLDTSYSMAGAPIDELNAGLRVFRDELLGDALAAKRVEVAIVTFGPVKVESGFCGAESFVAPVLKETGDTPMGAAIECALDLVEDRRQTYKTAGIKHYKPWIFLISDGGPTDDWTNAARRVREANDKKALSFFAVGVEGADLATMAKISVRPPLKLDGLKFRELFVWLSGSLGAVSGSSPDDDHVALKDPTKGDSWAAA